MTRTLTRTETVSFAATALERMTVPESARVMLVTGSLVEGLGNARSDVDIVSFADETIPGNALDVATGAVIDIAHVSGVRVDHEVWTVRYLEEVVERFGRFDPRHAKLFLSFTRHEIELLHSVITGVALRGADEHAEWVKRVDPSRFADAMRHMAHDAGEGFVDDAVGALRSDDLDTAVVMTLAADNAVVDAHIAASGITNTKLFKWRQRIVRDLGDPWLTRYWDAHAAVRRPDTTEPTAIAEAVTARIDNIRARAIEIELSLPFGALTPSRRRSPLARLRRFGSEYVVNMDSSTISCDSVDATIWAVATEPWRADAGAVATRVAALFPLEHGIDDAYVTSVTSDMRALGVLATDGGHDD